MHALRLGSTLGDPVAIGIWVVQGALRTLRATAKPCPIAAGPFFGLWGMADKVAGVLGTGVEATFWAQDSAIAQAQHGRLQGLVTAPINKAALLRANSFEFGRPEILGRTLIYGSVGLAFFTPKLQMIFTTARMPWRAVFEALAAEQVLEVIGLLHRGLRPTGRCPNCASPSLASIPMLGRRG